MTVETKPRVLIVGRSALPLTETVRSLRARGYGANATNQFDRVLDDYSASDLDLVIFGGQVPPELRTRLEAAIHERNPQVLFLSGLGGVAPLLVAQVEQHVHGTAPGVSYDDDARVLRLVLPTTAHVVVTGLWGEAVGFEPVPHELTVSDGERSPGSHEIAVPDEVPTRGAFVSARIGERVSVVRVGPAPRPQAATAASPPLPAPEPVTTRYPWTS